MSLSVCSSSSSAASSSATAANAVPPSFFSSSSSGSPLTSVSSDLRCLCVSQLSSLVPQYDVLFQCGVGLYATEQDSDTEYAIEIFSSLLQQGYCNQECRLYLGKCYARLGYIVRARRLLNQCLHDSEADMGVDCSTSATTTTTSSLPDDDDSSATYVLQYRQQTKQFEQQFEQQVKKDGKLCIYGLVVAATVCLVGIAAGSRHRH